MKKLTTLSLSLVLSLSLAVAQSEKSDAYNLGYNVGYYSALLWPYVLAVVIVFIIYNVITRKRSEGA